MRKVVVTFVLALTAVIMAAQAMAQQPDSQANTPANQKVIKDPAEYNAYITALNTQDPAQKAAAMEAFIKQYPQSVVLTDALEQAMAAYQQGGNQQKVQETASRILQINPNNVRALAIMTFLERATANTPDKAAKARQDGEKGLGALGSWTKPQDMSDADFAKLKDQMTVIFAGAAGFGALQAKDYPAARDFYLKSFKIDPNNLQDVYQLGIAYLEANPIDKTGFWYIAKAYHLAQGNAAGQKSIGDYGRSKYRKYHGNYDGWDQFLASVVSQSAPPAEIAIAPAPSAQELACKAVQENDPATLSFSDWEYILQYRDAGAACNKDAAEKVWQVIQNKQKDSKGEPAKLKINVKVISSSADSIDAAITEDNQKDNKADLHVVMDKPMTKPPAVGTTTDVIGTISAYTPSPFMFTMTAGELPAPPKPAVKKTPARRPGATKNKKK
jgi:tetratricopeptide (TPR) repeat protein